MIAERYATGDSHKEIAGRFHIAPATVRNHLAAVYRKLEVKNKPQLIRALAGRREMGGASGPGDEDATTHRILSGLDAEAPSPVDGASIAVMPFANIGPAETAYFGHGVVADIQHELTRCHDLFVSGRSSCLSLSEKASDPILMAKRLGVDYVLRGTTRRQGEVIRLTAELVEGASGTILWSERYDRKLNDILAVEAEVANAVVTGLTLQIEDAEFNRRRSLTADELTAYDLRLRGNRLLELGGAENIARARDCFARALALEPESAPAYAGLSMTYGYECDLLLVENYAESLARHIEFAERAVALDEADSRSHYVMVCARLMDGDYEQADAHAVRALELNPSEYHNICSRGYTLMSLGRHADSLACFNQSLRRNPLAPSSCLMALALIEYLEERYGLSSAILSRVTAYPVQRASTLAAARAQLGMQEAAREAAREFKSLSREVPIRPAGKSSEAWRNFWQLAYPYLKEASFEHLLDGIAKAKLPT